MAIAISSAIFLLLHGPFSPFSTRFVFWEFTKCSKCYFIACTMHTVGFMPSSAPETMPMLESQNVEWNHKCIIIDEQWTTKTDHNHHWWRMRERKSKKPETFGTNLMENYLLWNKWSSHMHITRTHTASSCFERCERFERAQMDCWIFVS